MEKWQVAKMVDYWNLWEAYAGESFIDYFVDDNIHDMGIVVGYFCGRFPKLGRYILEASEYRIPWAYIQDWAYKKETKEEIPSISHLVERFYNAEDENGRWSQDNYDKVVCAWCCLIHDIDIYYQRFIEWVERNKDEKLTQKLNEIWNQEK